MTATKTKPKISSRQEVEKQTKMIFVIRAPLSEPLGLFRSLVLDKIAPALKAHGPERLKVTISCAEPPAKSIVPYTQERIALLSVWDASCGSELLDRWGKYLAKYSAAIEGYIVEESVPKGYTRDWPDGQESPGMGLLTLFKRKPGISYEYFHKRWFEGHSPLAIKVHPFWNYVRNRVLDSIGNTKGIEGIVEEHFKDAREATSQVKMFGGLLRMVPNMIRVGTDIIGWMDTSAIDNYLTSEHWIKG